MSQPLLVLASGSPRRRQLLEEAGYAIQITPPREGAEEEGLCSNCGPAELVARLALLKWKDVADQLNHDDSLLLLAADTVAECDGHILGKPADEEHARRMIRHMSGREHRVYTGVCIGHSRDASEPILRVEMTTLRMDNVSEEWLDNYTHSGAWEGKAGGFGYQDSLGFVHIQQGSESNVVGLPMELVTELLESYGCWPTPR